MRVFVGPGDQTSTPKMWAPRGRSDGCPSSEILKKLELWGWFLLGKPLGLSISVTEVNRVCQWHSLHWKNSFKWSVLTFRFLLFTSISSLFYLFLKTIYSPGLAGLWAGYASARQCTCTFTHFWQNGQRHVLEKVVSLMPMDSILPLRGAQNSCIYAFYIYYITSTLLHKLS